MKIFDNFVIDAPERKRANFKIVPFLESDLTKNTNIHHDNNLDNYFSHRFPNYHLSYTERGRACIPIVLKALKLQKQDTITIITTTNNFYISSCVTNEIEKVCQWSREITDKTKAIFVNHEFGYCYENLRELRQYNLPIIEDFAHSFSATNSANTQGSVGDFLIFSFSKFFPIQIGGALLYKKKYIINTKIDNKIEYYIKNVVGSHINNIKAIEQQRLKNYYYLKKIFATLHCSAHIPLLQGSIPAVFMFNLPRHIDLLQFKEFMNIQGVESSIFYGKHAYFIPSHQNFNEEELFFFYTLVKYFLQQSTFKEIK